MGPSFFAKKGSLDVIETLVATVFATRDAAHIDHWAARGPGSYARHVALGAFYTDVIAKLDAIVEAYQGAKGLIGVVAPAPRMNIGPLSAHIDKEADWIAANREGIANGVPSVLNLVDDLHATYCQTAYKLRFLE